MIHPRLLADSGSTKTDWLLVCDDTPAVRFTTGGINPFIIDRAEIEAVIRTELLPQYDFSQVRNVEFYGAGCRGTGLERVREALQAVWPAAESIEVAGDLLGAARALFPSGDGIACILGTGSNSGLYLGGEIVRNVPPLGYILGDEGSGASLGKRLIGDLLKGLMPEEEERAFRAAFPDLTTDEIIERTYRRPLPNRFLAGFAPYLHYRRTAPAIKSLLTDEFSRFFRRNIVAYRRPDLPVGLVGSVAFYFYQEIAEAALTYRLRIERILKAPFDDNNAIDLGHLTNETD